MGREVKLERKCLNCGETTPLQAKVNIDYDLSLMDASYGYCSGCGKLNAPHKIQRKKGGLI